MGRKKMLAKKLWSNIIILVAFIVALICCASILRNILWENTNEMGLSLVKNYSSAEEQNIKTCEAVLNICTSYVAEREQSGLSPAELREGLYPFMNGLTSLYGKDKIHAYGKIYGGSDLVSIVPEIEAMTDYDFTDTEWFQGAVAANGETYLSPAYTDALTGLPVVTMCKRIPETGSFLAIDMKLSCFETNGQDMALPEQASYFLVDQEGTVLYYLSSWDYTGEEFQELVDHYRETAVCKTANHVSENVKGSDGIIRNVFFHHMDNGWTGILTIPKDEILSGSDTFRNISFVLIGFGIVLVLFQFIQEYRNEKRKKEYLVYQKRYEQHRSRVPCDLLYRR